jgi:hypothetical protein
MKALLWILACAFALAWGYHDLPASYFLRDDFMWLEDSRHQLADPIQFVTTRPSGYFRPFANIVFGLEYAFFGLQPRGFYVVNLLIHAWSVFWLAKLVRQFGGSLAMAGASALAAASLTAAAPGVVWISGLVSLLGVAMVLPAVFFYRRFQLRGEWGAYVLALVFTLCAVGSRESGVLAGVGILCLEGLRIGELRGARPWALGFVGRMAPFALAAGAYLWVQWEFVTSGAGARGASGSPLAYVLNVITSVPAMLRAEEWRRWFSLGAGALGLMVWLGALGALRGRRGVRLGLVLIGLLLVVFLPTYMLLSRDYVMANRYRYEAVFVIALMIGALVEALGGWRERQTDAQRIDLSAQGAPASSLPSSASDTAESSPSAAWRPAVALCLLSALVAWHLAALPRYVRGDERFALYANATRDLADELDAHFGEQLIGAQTLGMFGVANQSTRIALVGVPVENPKHLRDQLAVFYDFPPERVDEVAFDLTDAFTANELRQRQAGFVKDACNADEVWVWQPDNTLQRGAPVLSAMNKDWRQPGKIATVSKVQVLEFPKP